MGAEQKDRFNEPPQTTDGKTIEPPRRTSGEPVEVSLGLYLIQVSNLDQIQQTFEIEGYLEASWSDPRLAFDAAAFGATKKVYQNDRALAKLGEDVWWPAIEFVNASGQESLDRPWLEVDSVGGVSFTARFTAIVPSSMDLRRFPFDSQTLRVPIESYFYGTEDVVFVVHEETTGFDRSRTLPEWEFVPNSPVIDVHRYVQRGPFYPDFSRFTFQFTIHRQSAYYLWKIFLPLLLIVAASWTVFWIDDLGINIGTAFTMMLTVVAFNFAIADTLPRVPYLTFMDAVLLASYISVFLSIIVLMVAHRFRAAGNQSASDRTKRVSRYAFPGGLAVVVGALVTIFLR